jgi:hypothetical protein
MSVTPVILFGWGQQKGENIGEQWEREFGKREGG